MFTVSDLSRMRLCDHMKSNVASLVKKSLRKFGIDIHYTDPDDPRFYIDVLRGAISVKKPLNIVQIGANDGKYGDPIYNFVKRHGDSTNILLVEPQEKLIPHLTENYSYHPSAEIVNKAVSTGEEDSISLYRIREEYWSDINATYGDGWPDYRVPTGVTTSDKTELLQWTSENIDSRDHPEEVIEHFEVESNLPETIINKSDIMDSVDVLQVDTEAMDDEIVYSFFNQGIYPSIINIEDSHLKNNEIKNFDHELESNSYTIYNYTKTERLGLKY